VQLDSIKTRVETRNRPWFQRLKLQYDESLSNFAFNVNLRRYSVDVSFDGTFISKPVMVPGLGRVSDLSCGGLFTLGLTQNEGLVSWAGASTASLFSSTLTVSDTQKHPTHPKTPPNTPLARATQPLRAPPIAYKVLKLN
jgi:hypothetical protein